MPQSLRIDGIRAEGRHGAREGERDAPQPFTVDLEIEVNAVDDELDTTADYREVVTTVRELIEKESHRIIETLAERIAQTVAGMSGVRACRARIHKPAAAERLGIADVTAEATASRAP
ncbi:MAG TPA: dihydroneopterin aldolase [Actinomycetota bacterium]|nr:dihydroneopterin aldolase [Actinomycetota bacterium]